MPRLTTFCAAALAALALASPALAGRGMFVGAAEDAGKAPDLVTAKAKMDLARLAGFNVDPRDDDLDARRRPRPARTSSRC